MPVIEIWTCDRVTKTSIVVPDFKVARVLSKVNQKLKINGCTIVRENNGTTIDEDDALKHYRSEALMVLQKDEVWSETCGKKVSDTELDELLGNYDNVDGINSVEENVSETVLKKSITEDTVEDTPTDQEKIIENGATTSESLPVDTSEAVGTSDTVKSILASKKISSWDEYKIPWVTIDANILQKLNDGCPITDSNKQNFITRVVDEMRFFEKHIPRNVFEKVAIDLRDAYPKSFEDRLRNGQRMGEGIATVVNKMVNYNNNQNRPHMTESLNSKLKIPINKRKALASIKAGCSNWQPDKLPDDQDENSQEERREFLLNFKTYNLTDDNMLATVKQHFEETYATQRLFLNNIENKNHLCSEVQKMWPCLLKQPFIFWHYKLLTGHDEIEMQSSIEEDKKFILTYGIMKKFIEMDCLTSGEELETLAALRVICKHFKEELETIFIECPVSNR